jgi:hypothetical protein
MNEDQKAEGRRQKAEVRGQRSEIEVRGQRSEVRGQKSEVRGQRSEVRSQRSEVRFPSAVLSWVLIRGYPRESAANSSICFHRVGIRGDFLLESLHWSDRCTGTIAALER